jgi:hypothetical protein
MASDLPTIEYVGADGVRRELDFQRAPHAPWQALLVESEAVDGEMRYLYSTTTQAHHHARNFLCSCVNWTTLEYRFQIETLNWVTV